MKVREFLKCLTCDHIHTIRVSVGHNPIQRHDFACASCEEPIGLIMHVDYHIFSTEIEFCENCDLALEEGSIVNLDPHFLIHESDLDADRNFGWMQEAQYIMAANPEVAILPTAPNSQAMVDTYEQLGGLPGIYKYWNTLKKAWSLRENKKNALAAKVIKKYDPRGYKITSSIDGALKDFFHRLTLPKAYHLTESGYQAIKNAKTGYPEEFKRFVNFYTSQMHLDNMRGYFDIFNEFFEHYSEFDQSILYTKNLAPVREGHVASSFGFSRTKMFYGNAYEIYTSNIAVLACINNILQGRKFDEFKMMDLSRYNTINKANRGTPFADNPLLSGFLECTESTLRNASHHQSMMLIDKGKRIQYQSGGTGQIKVITYSNYLEKCCQILMCMSSLFLLEMEIKENS